MYVIFEKYVLANYKCFVPVQLRFDTALGIFLAMYWQRMFDAPTADELQQSRPKCPERSK